MAALFNINGKNTRQLSYYLLLSFWLGFATFVIELLGPRILAPYIGTEFTVWANIIGMTLAGLSLGYLTGGRYADSDAGKRLIAWLLFACGASILFIALAGELVTIYLALALKNTSLSSLAASALLFFPFNFLLGSLNPIIAKLFASADNKRMGRQIGLLYMLSSVGSFIGIFVTSYLLIPSLELHSILLFCALIFMILSLLNTPLNKAVLLAGAASLVLYGLASSGSRSILTRLFGDNRILFNRDTVYSKIRVFLSRENGRQKLTLVLNNATEGVQYKDAPDVLAMNYLTYFPVMNLFNDSIGSALMIGGGANNYASRLFADHPRAHLDVVEIDPEVTRVTNEFFQTPGGAERISYIHEDGRTYVNRTGKTYDTIILDAFSGYTIPFQLTTVEFFENARRRLGPKGTIVINTISALEGEQGKMFEAQYRTLGQAFPYIYAFPTKKGEPRQIQNIILVGAKHPLPKTAPPSYRKFLTGTYVPPRKEKATILTDSFAPVEFLVKNN